MAKYTDEQLAQWNEQHPVGTPVLAWPGSREEAPAHTYVSAPATRWSWGECMAYVKTLGNISLTHLAASTLPTEEHERQYRQDTLRNQIRGGVGIEADVRNTVQRHMKVLQADLTLFEGLPTESVTWSSNLVDLALWQQVRAQAEEQISQGVSRLWRAGMTLGLARPAALDHRQRVTMNFKPERMPAVREELTKWLHGQPDKQPFKPEILAEEAVPGYDQVRVTFAVQDASEALGLGFQLGWLSREGGQNG